MTALNLALGNRANCTIKYFSHKHIYTNNAHAINYIYKLLDIFISFFSFVINYYTL